jgi:two-component system sensor histidine kinase DegS
MITAYYYNEQIKITGTIILPEVYFSLTENAINLLLYLIPIVYSTLIFNLRGGLMALALSLIVILSKPLFFPTDITGSFTTPLVVAVLSVAVLLWVNFQKRQREKLKQAKQSLVSARQKADFEARVATEHANRLAAITAFSAMLNQSVEVGQLIETAVNMVKAVMHIEVVLIFFLDKRAKELRITAFEGVNQKYALAVDGMKLGEGFCGYVAETGEPLIVDSSTNSDLISPEAKEEKLRAQVSVPLSSQGQIVGTLCAGTRTLRRFSHAEVELLNAIGDLIGVALENSRLNEARENAIRQLGVSEKKYRQLFENAQDAIWVQDLFGVITSANEAAANLFGYPLSKLIGINIRELLSQGSPDLSKEAQDKLLSGEKVRQPYTQKLVKKDGTEIVLTLTTNLISGNGHPDGFQFIGRDRTREMRMQENQSFYLEQITKAHEEERSRISRDLHDSTAQNLIGLLHQLESFCYTDEHLPTQKLNVLWSFYGRLNEMLQEIRQLSRDLRPSILDHLGFLASVDWLTDQFRSEHEIEVDAVVLGKSRRFSPEIEVTLFRIVQEALRNIAKHAEATEVRISIDFRDKETRTTISDNGKGFEVPSSLGELSRLGKLGIDGMITRARLVDGTFDIKSELGKGTSLIITVPA